MMDHSLHIPTRRVRKRRSLLLQQFAWRTLCLMFLGLSVACGGGSSGAMDTQTDSVSIENAALNGIVSIEQRFGKTMLDAWFAPNTQLSLPKSGERQLFVDEPCSVDTVPHDQLSSTSALSDDERAFDSRHSVQVAASISFDTRAGSQATLSAMQLGQTVVYSTIDRWLDEPLAEDTQLNFADAIERWPLHSVSVAPLSPLVLITPTQGLLPNITQRIEWEEGGELAQTNSIHIRLSVLHDDDDGMASRSDISCITQDDGSFTLPNNIQEQLTDDAQVGQAMLFMVRKRMSLHEEGDAVLALSQTSYANP